MAFKLAEAFVSITGNTNLLDQKLSQAHSKLGSFVSSANKMLAGIGIGIGIGAVVKELIEAGNKAADLGETLSKVQTVFGPGAKLIIAQADEMADKFGLVKTEIMDAAASFGLVGQAAGMTKQASAALGVQFAKLAADASSFFNVSLSEALTRLQSGLVGEAEPMRRFGVLLSEDAVKAEALRMGLVKTKKAAGDLSEQMKVKARVSLISAGLGTASGDLERTADSAKNQMRKFWGDLENFKTEFGKNMIEPLTEAMKVARQLGVELQAAAKTASEFGVTGENISAWIASLGLVGIHLKGQGREALQAEADKRAGVKVGLPGLPPGALPAAPSPEDIRQKAIGDLLINRMNVAHLAAMKVAEADMAKLKKVGEQLASFGERFLQAGVVRLALAAQAGSSNIAMQRLGQEAIRSGTGPGGLLLAGAMKGLGAVNQGVRREPEQFQSQAMSAEDFERMGVTTALSGGNIPQQQLEAQKQAVEKLDGVIEAVKGLAGGAQRAVGAILRGRV